MAHKLTSLRQNIKVHQALHGYVDGHREVAASHKLNTHDSKTMLILSDISSSGIHIEEGGYLTGYPLTDSGYYAIAKTWIAPEITRPGCVWTHTLLIDFADLANLRNARELLALFRRPILGELSGYSMPLTMDIASDEELNYKPELISTNSRQWLRQLLFALYDRPEKRVFATYSSEFDPTPVVLALWFQQWPRLRRAFCFCTSTTTDRSSDRVSFDLQLVPKEGGIRGQFPNAIDVADVPITNSWIDHAFDDFKCPKTDSLRLFLRRVGGDVTTGRHAFAELTIFHKLIEESEFQPALFDEIITILDDESTISSVMAVRVIAITKAASQVKSLNLRALDFLVRNLSLLDKEITLTQAENIGYSIWTKNPAIFAGLIDTDGAGNSVTTSTIASLSYAELIEGLQVATKLIVPVLALRPDIVMEPRLWQCDVNIRNAALNAVHSSSSDKWPAIIRAMIISGVDDIVKPAFNCFSYSAVWQILIEALDKVKKVKPHALLPWLKYAMLDKGAVAQVLADSDIRMKNTLVTIARMTTPDSIPNEFGKDPWLLATQDAKGNLDQSEEIYLMAYLFSRALGWTSRNSDDLISRSFDTVYCATLKNSINDDAWGLLNARLPDAGWFDSWDRCKRLRHAVSELFIHRNLPAKMFGQLSENDKIFSEIASIESHLYKGNHYLKEVRKALSSDDSHQFSERIHILDKLLD